MRTEAHGPAHRASFPRLSIMVRVTEQPFPDWRGKLSLTAVSGGDRGLSTEGTTKSTALSTPLSVLKQRPLFQQFFGQPSQRPTTIHFAMIKIHWLVAANRPE